MLSFSTRGLCSPVDVPDVGGTGIAKYVPVSLTVYMETTAKRETGMAFPKDIEE
jgi:hypothetical protein